MESKDILKILENFEKESSYKKIFINGKWGIGKSFYTNQYIKNKSSAVYISLFGKNSIESIQEEIAKELFKKVNSTKKYFKKIKELLKKISGSISCYGISINSPEIKSKTFIEEYYSILEEENLIIVIDDLERKSSNIAIEDVLGIIEQLSLCNKIKIVLIGDESKLNEKDKKIWDPFKEKLVEKEYKILRFSKEAINNLVISKLENYIDKETLDKFVEDFFNKFSVNNLRTINKGVNLFLEIKNIYLYKEYPGMNLTILKTCMAVVVETTENLFRPVKEDNEKEDFTKDFFRSLDENMETRIQRHYFNSPFITNKEATLTHYILAIYEGNETESLIDEMNQVIEKYLNVKEEKNIFYLDETKIKDIVSNKYRIIIKNQYEYTCLDKFIDDIYNILNWYEKFDMKYDEQKLKEAFKIILFKNYYSNEKDLYENEIDRFELKYENCSKLKIFVDDYNKKAEETYYTEKIKIIEKSYREEEYDVQKLRWIDNAFIQSNKEIQFERFITKARANNYFISNISGEISEEEWRWTHYIWNIFYKYMSQDYKNELEKYVNKMKGKNKLEDLRIESLQEYKPLIKKEE